MKNIFRKKYIISLTLLVLLLSPPLHSGDTSTCRIIGFSRNGEYLAFERYGIYDGSGFPYSEIFIVNAIQNSWAITPRILIQGDTGEDDDADPRKKNLNRAAAELARFGIIAGNSGRAIQFEHSADTETDLKRFTLKGISYALRLVEMSTERDCFGFGKAKIFELTLTREHRTKTLQRDRALPRSRGCALRYTIDQVYIYRNIIAVFIAVITPGFEGPNIRQLVVTGTLD